MGNAGFEITGWLLFVASAIAFTISAWESGDGAALAGALLFLVACFVFLLPLLRRVRRKP
ncbi:MAG: cytochrome oxidase subunit III [Geminicoccaceae bacterium]